MGGIIRSKHAMTQKSYCKKISNQDESQNQKGKDYVQV